MQMLPRQRMNSSPSHRLPGIQPSLSRKLSIYLTGAAGTATLLTVSQADGAVVASNFAPLNLGRYSYRQTLSFGTNGSLATLFNSRRESIGGYPADGTVYNSQLWYQYGAYFGKASFFANGTVIGNGNNGGLGYAFFYSGLNNIPNSDLTIPTDITGNIAFKTSSGHYGWANVSWERFNKSLTINSAYVESVAGATITVGDTGVSAAPEPGRALLALAGLAGVGMRRRRRQVAQS